MLRSDSRVTSVTRGVVCQPHGSLSSMDTKYLGWLPTISNRGLPRLLFVITMIKVSEIFLLLLTLLRGKNSLVPRSNWLELLHELRLWITFVGKRRGKERVGVEFISKGKRKRFKREEMVGRDDTRIGERCQTFSVFETRRGGPRALKTEFYSRDACRSFCPRYRCWQQAIRIAETDTI